MLAGARRRRRRLRGSPSSPLSAGEFDLGVCRAVVFWARTSQRSCRGGFAAPARARMPEGVRIAYCDSGAGNLGGWGLGRARSRGGFAGGVSLRVRVSFGWFQVREKLNSS